MPLVLTLQQVPSYDDLPELRYHFPKRYLKNIESGIDDWFVYYEPRRHQAGSEAPGGRQCYFATGRISHVVPDDKTRDHYYAYITDYLEFDSEVPFKEGDRYFEKVLRKDDGTTNKGRFGWSVRTLPRDEYEQILVAGFTSNQPLLKVGPQLPAPDLQELAERPIVEAVTRAVFRDYKFRQHIQRAYGPKCAMTGLDILDDRAISEVEAAHIRPAGAGHNGPDSVRNGMALSRTVHWLFDHGFLAAEDNGTILVSHRGVPDKVKAMLNRDQMLILPEAQSDRPHPQFLRYHRENIFKG